MLFTELLQKHGLTEETVSHALKVKIKRYNKFVETIAKEKANLSAATTERAKQASEKEITKGEEYLVTLNEDICAHVEKFADNRELNERKAENLKKTRAAKGKEKSAEAGSTQVPSENPASESTPSESSTPVPEETVVEEETPATEEVAVVEEKKKKSSPWGLLAAIALAVVTGGAIAYHHFKNKE